MLRVLSLSLVILVLVLLKSISSANASFVVAAVDEEAIIVAVKTTLDAQVTAWNSGDIPGFMKGYVHSKELRFASGNTVAKGWETTLQRYQERYSDRKLMGTLEFKDLTITPLSARYAEVFGRFHLSRDSDTGDATGLFTLLMQKTEKGWLVLHDHTSSE